MVLCGSSQNYPSTGGLRNLATALLWDQTGPYFPTSSDAWYAIRPTLLLPLPGAYRTLLPCLLAASWGVGLGRIPCRPADPIWPLWTTGRGSTIATGHASQVNIISKLHMALLLGRTGVISDRIINECQLRTSISISSREHRLRVQWHVST